MNTTAVPEFKIDRSLRINITIAVLLVIGCPIALWQFHFRERQSQVNETDTYRQLILNYVRAYNQPHINAKTVFAPEVRLFLDDSAQNPVSIDHAVALERQTRMYPRAVLLPDSVYINPPRDGERTVYAWIQEVHYLKNERKYRKADVHYEFVFNAENKIISLQVMDTRYETFSNTMPK